MPDAHTRPVQRRRLPIWKKLVFGLVTTCLSLATAELILAVCGVRPALTREDPFVGFVGSIPLFVEHTAPDGTVILETADNKLPYFNRQSFPKHKGPNTFRVFCVGGSTTFGHPYQDPSSFCGWLRRLLPVADDSRNWEVVNAGGISYASYRVAALMAELAEYQPDLFVVYCGHNEFLEERTYRSLRERSRLAGAVYARLSRTRVYSGMASLLHRDRNPASGDRGDRELLSGEVAAVLDGTIGPTSYHRDDALKKEVLSHFRFSLGRMAEIAREAGANVIFVTPAANLKDCTPFRSEHVAGLTEARRKTWQEAFDRGRGLLQAGQASAALAALDEALTMDARYAELQYRRGQALLMLKRFDEAKAAFQRAVDEDVCALRALTGTAETVRRIASENGAGLVDFVALVEQRTEARLGHRIPGREYFLDHVHGTVATYRTLALAIVDEMVRQGYVTPGPDWGPAAVERVAQQGEAALDAEAQATALCNLAKTLGWAGKIEESRRLIDQALELNPGDPEALLTLASHLENEGKIAEALEHVRTVSLQRFFGTRVHLRLARLLFRSGDLEAALAHALLAVRLDPELPHAYRLVGQIRLARRDPLAAVAYFRAALTKAPGFHQARAELEQAMAQLADPSAAGELVEVPPLHVETHPNKMLRLLVEVRRNAEGDYVPHGACARWDQTGRLSKYTEYCHGEPNGISVTWAPNGRRTSSPPTVDAGRGSPQ